MNAWQRFQRWLFDTGNDLDGYTLEEATSQSYAAKSNTLDLKILSMATALGYLAVGLASCDWRLIKNGQEIRNEEYFRLNCRPNPKQTKYDFCMKLLYKLGWDNEAVIFSPDWTNDLFIADSFNVEPVSMTSDRYTNVRVDGDNRVFNLTTDEVMHIKLNWIGLRPLLYQVASEYEDLISTAALGYEKQTGERGTLTMASGATGTEDQYRNIVARLREQFDSYFKATSAVIPVPRGYTYTPNATAHRNTSEINDLINLSDEWCERLGLALRFPVALLKGNVENTEHARNDLISYGIRQSLAEPIMEAYNAKRIGKNAFLRGSYLLIDTISLYLTHPDNIGSYCDKMISTAQASPDDLRRLRKEPVVGTPESSKLYITLNYASLDAPSVQGNDATTISEDEPTEE